MLTAQAISDGKLITHDIASLDQLAHEKEILWLDLKTPTEEERNWLTELYKQKLPTEDSINEIEASSRFFVDEHGLHMRAYFLAPYLDTVEIVTLSFTFKKEFLFTLHFDDSDLMKHLFEKLKTAPELENDPMQILIMLFAAQIDRVADILENLYVELERYSKPLFSSVSNVAALMTHVADIEDVNSKVRLSLMDEQRVLAELMRSNRLSESHQSYVKEVLRDIESLTTHSSMLFEKVKFLMDVGISKTNIEQNKIIAILSIVAVVFLPPTLVASIYGMNFKWMPELSWTLGYPLAILIMIAFAIAPYLYFKSKGWLRF